MLKKLLLAAAITGPAFADAPVVENVTARATAQTWSFSVTVSHPDTGWDHYADGWTVFAPNGDVLGVRPLAHPHVTEQPFTRSLSGVVIAPEITNVVIRAKDTGGDWSDDYVFELSR